MGARKRLARGQAMLEYSIVTWALVVGLMLGCTVHIIPGPRTSTSPARPAMSVVELFLSAYQTQYDSYLYTLSLPVP